MGLAGDLKTLNLTDLIQTISQTAQEGSLSIRSGERQKTFIFGAKGITLETSDEKLASSLGEILVSLGKFGPEQLAQAEATAKTKPCTLEEAILDGALADRKTVDQALRMQVEEEMYDVFSWEAATFEFTAGKRGVPDAAKGRTRLYFNVSGLLMEAARRFDEWRILQKKIPGLAIVLAAGEGLAPDSLQGAEKTVAGLVDGRRTVGEIATAARLPKFDVCKSLAKFLDEGKVRHLTQEEIARVAVAASEAGEAEKAHAMLRIALAHDPEKHALRLRLAEALEVLGKKSEAAAEYRKLAEVKVAARDPKTALDILKVAAELDPQDLSIRGRMLDVTVADLRAAAATPATLIRDFLPYVRALSGAKRNDEASVALAKLLKVAPADVDLRRAEVSLRLSTGDTAGAVAAYLAIVPTLEAAGNREAAKTALRNALKLDPASAEAQARLDELEGVPAKRARSRRTAVVVGSVVVTLAGLGGVAGWREMGARRALTAAESDAQRMESGGGFAEAAKRYQEVRDAFPMTLAGGEAGRRAAAYGAKAAEQGQRVETERRAREATVEAREADGRALLEKGDRAGALAAFVAAREAAAGLPAAEGLAAEVRKIEALENEASALRREAEAFEATGRDGDQAKAYARWREILARHAVSAAARGVRLPVRVASFPSGAEALDGGNVLGKTPLTLRLAPGEVRALELRRRGFLPARLAVEADRGPGLDQALERVPLWTARTGGSVETLALGGEGRLLAGGRDSQLYAFAEEDGARLWTRPTGLLGDVAASPAELGRVAMAGARNGAVVAADVRTGGNLWRAEVGAPVEGGLSVDAGRETVLVATESGGLHALSVADGKPRWAAPAALGSGSRGGPVLAGDRAFVATARGELVAVAVETGGALWRATLRGAGMGAVVSGDVAVASSAGGVAAFALADGAPRWEATPPAAPIGAPFLAGLTGLPGGAGDFVVVALADGSIAALSAADGTPRWRTSLPTRACGRIAWSASASDSSGVFLVATEGGALCGIEAGGGGRLLWTHKASEKPLRAGVVSRGGIAFVGGADSTVQAFVVE
ncbi:MAG: PQQ-binding-like beta-propeller repeat protein [Planctomycetales bacterium]|nr:PQQ-binding-like beta-propeller repeat protein [Planctomycetales bacterium]